jgi:hypothetical protein
MIAREAHDKNVINLNLYKLQLAYEELQDSKIKDSKEVHQMKNIKSL